jgi:acylphosphatase
MEKQCTLKVFGMVQGVNFRSETLQKAQKLGLVGFVRNEPDSSVYIEAQGEEVQLKDFIQQCKQGYSLYQVSNIQTQWSNELQDYQNFTIER